MTSPIELVVTSCFEKKICIWNPSTLLLVQEIHHKYLFSPWSRFSLHFNRDSVRAICFQSDYLVTGGREQVGLLSVWKLSYTPSLKGLPQEKSEREQKGVPIDAPPNPSPSPLPGSSSTPGRPTSFLRIVPSGVSSDSNPSPSSSIPPPSSPTDSPSSQRLSVVPYSTSYVSPYPADSILKPPNYANRTSNSPEYTPPPQPNSDRPVAAAYRVGRSHTFANTSEHSPPVSVSASTGMLPTSNRGSPALYPRPPNPAPPPPVSASPLAPAPTPTPTPAPAPAPAPAPVGSSSAPRDWMISLFYYPDPLNRGSRREDGVPVLSLTVPIGATIEVGRQEFKKKFVSRKLWELEGGTDSIFVTVVCFPFLFFSSFSRFFFLILFPIQHGKPATKVAHHNSHHEKEIEMGERGEFKEGDKIAVGVSFLCFVSKVE
jgi:hypothetical protein